MGNSDRRPKSNQSEKYFSLTGQPRRMKLLDEPHGFTAGMSKDNLGHQMRYSVETLEAELAKNGTPHVLQLQLDGDDQRNPFAWTLYADGAMVADGLGEYARQCFYEKAEAFRDVCRDAVAAAKLPAWDEREYKLLRAARNIAEIASE